MEAAARMEAAVIVIVAAREAVLVAETADAATVTVLADISGLSECDHELNGYFFPSKPLCLFRMRAREK